MIVKSTDKIFSQSLRLMGNSFVFSVAGTEENKANYIIQEGIREVKRIEKLFTTFDETSQTSLINQHAGVRPIKVDKEVFDLINRSMRLSRLTQGAFDITYGSMDKRFWNFDQNMTSLPDKSEALKMVRLINYRNVHLDEDQETVFLTTKGMRIGFGGIGKGYAADRAKLVMRNNGAVNGLVNAAGDLTVWGLQPNGKPWTIGIADPDQKEQPFASIKLSDISVATSGNYEKFVIIGGKKYSHTIDPKTGYPIKGIKSTTIICQSAELADAMATPVSVMGIKAGVGLIDQMKNIACIVIDDKDRIFTSKNINNKTFTE